MTPAAEGGAPERSVLREPLLHFALIGLLLFGVSMLLAPQAPEPLGENHILVDEGRISQLSTAFERTWQRAPTQGELQGLIDDFVTEEILYREARSLGLDENDTIIRRRLRQKMEFILDDLIQGQPPSDAELADYLRQNLERFRADPVLSFRQVYLSHDRFGAGVPAEAERLLLQLRRDDSGWSSLGQELLSLERSYEGLQLAAADSLFGGDVAEALKSATPGAWAGPVRSGFGLHLLFVETRSEPPAPSLEQVRESVTREWELERRKRATAEALDAMRERYRIEVRTTNAQ